MTSAPPGWYPGPRDDSRIIVGVVGLIGGIAIGAAVWSSYLN